jgi:hypothetical protein
MYLSFVFTRPTDVFSRLMLHELSEDDIPSKVLETDWITNGSADEG